MVVDGLAIHYETYGEGVPAVLIPRCNFAWSALDLAVLTGDYTVVIASPRGFGESERTEGPYTAASIKSDLEAVLDPSRLQRRRPARPQSWPTTADPARAAHLVM